MNHSPLQPNPELDRVLQALTNPEPTPGMAQRIVANLAAQPAPRPRRATFLVPSFATAILLLVLFATHRTATPKSGQWAVSSPATPRFISPMSPEPGRRGSTESPSQPQSEATVLRARLQPCHNCPSFTAASAAAAMFPADMARTNFPAQPVPLTDQEILLLRLARHTDPRVATAALAEEAREQQSQRATVEFETFFAQPIPPPQTPNPNPTGDESWQPTGN